MWKQILDSYISTPGSENAHSAQDFAKYQSQD
jgi:hypothetical protein